MEWPRSSSSWRNWTLSLILLKVSFDRWISTWDSYRAAATTSGILSALPFRIIGRGVCFRLSWQLTLDLDGPWIEVGYMYYILTDKTDSHSVKTRFPWRWNMILSSLVADRFSTVVGSGATESWETFNFITSIASLIRRTVWGSVKVFDEL